MALRSMRALRRAVEVAVAGNHNLLMIGPPGAGKSLLASCLPGILPELTPAEALADIGIINGLPDERAIALKLGARDGSDGAFGLKTVIETEDGVELWFAHQAESFVAPGMMAATSTIRPIWVRMPANRPLMRPFVFSRPVMTPAISPATKAMRIAMMGLMPLVIEIAATAAPVVNEPSTVRSGKSRMRKVR